jgi:hypothetical protein
MEQTAVFRPIFIVPKLRRPFFRPSSTIPRYFLQVSLGRMGKIPVVGIKVGLPHQINEGRDGMPAQSPTWNGKGSRRAARPPRGQKLEAREDKKKGAMASKTALRDEQFSWAADDWAEL